MYTRMLFVVPFTLPDFAASVVDIAVAALAGLSFDAVA